jgi:hypothetical protein
MGQRVERPFSLVKATDQLHPIGIGIADIEQPDEDGAGPRGRRSERGAQLDNLVAPGQPQLAADRRPAQSNVIDSRGKDAKILPVEAMIVSRQLGEPLGSGLQPQFANQLGIRLDAVIGLDEDGPRRRGIEQRAHGSRRAEHGLGPAQSAGSEDRQGGRERHPQGGDDNDCRRGLGADDHPTLPPSFIRPS